MEKKSTYCLLLALLLHLYNAMPVLAQKPVQETSTTTEQQLEAVTEGNEDNETQDDTFLQSLQQFLKSPINLNQADAYLLKELSLLSPLQIQNLINYRSLLGPLINIYEMQAIPGWDLATIDKVKPFVTVATSEAFTEAIGKRLKGGTHGIVGRITQVVEKSRGFLVDPATTTNYYPGSPQRYFFRYKYQYKNLLQYGFLGEKDAGEQFFKGAQKMGFDFNTFHLFARNIGAIKALAIGDFTVNLGQGLIQWQSLAFKKNQDVINVKRQLAILRPYNAAGEFNFHRGAGITTVWKKWEATAFVSLRNLDANLQQDTITNEDDFVSSFQTSGLHRTKNEVADRGVQRQMAAGGNISYKTSRWQVGFNAIQYQFKLPVQRANEPYNLYAISGKRTGNQSIDYSLTWKNMHFFGEAATDNNFNTAFINGVIMSADTKVDLSLVYRNISPRYQALNSNAFTESTQPTNEKGVYAGISIKPTNSWRLDAYADFYHFPWLRFQTDAPTTGADYFTQLTYKPNKVLEIYARYRYETKKRNFNPDDNVLNPVIARPRQNFRWQLNYKLNSTWIFRNRVEMVWWDRNSKAAQTGFLAFTDLLYKPMMKRLSGNMRLQYFDTDGYDSRLYAFENDVLYSFSIPVFYDKGYRYYLNLNYDVSKKLGFWLRIAQTIFSNRTSIGSGLDEIAGNRRTEIKLQAQVLF